MWHPALDPPCWTLLRYFHLTPQVNSPLLPQTPTRFVLRFVTFIWFREELGIEAGRFFSAPTAIAPFVARVVGDHNGKRVGSLYPLAETFRLNVPWRMLVVPAVLGTLVGWGRSAKYREWCGVGGSACVFLHPVNERAVGCIHTMYTFFVCASVCGFARENHLHIPAVFPTADAPGERTEATGFCQSSR